MELDLIRVKLEAARRFKRQKDFRQAEKELIEALEIDPGNVLVKTHLADIYYHMNRISEAERMLKEVLHKEPLNIKALYLSGLIAYKKQELEKALEFFQNILKIKKHYFPAQKMVVTILAKMHKWDEALTWTHRALEIHPNDSFVLTQLARIYRAQKKYNEALDVLDKLRQQGKDNEFIRKQIIELKALCTGKTEEQISQEISSMLNLPSQQNRPELWQIQAENLRKKGKLAEAVEAYKKLLMLDPENDFARKQLAYLYKRLGEWEKAVEQMTSLFLKNPSDIYLRNSLYSLYREHYSLYSWIQLLKDALKRNPEMVSLYGLIRKFRSQLDLLAELDINVEKFEALLEKIEYREIIEPSNVKIYRPVLEFLLRYLLAQKMLPSFGEFLNRLKSEERIVSKIPKKTPEEAIAYIFQYGIFWIHFYLVSRQLSELDATAFRLDLVPELAPVVWIFQKKEIHFEIVSLDKKIRKPVIKSRGVLRLRIPEDFLWSYTIKNWKLANLQDMASFIEQLKEIQL